MSSEAEAINGTRCASCGVAEGDDIKLRNCTACHLVKYCGVKCQKEHRPKHKRECKKRAAELRDEILFKQPESSHLGDCPICCLPISIDVEKSIMMACCSQQICKGCSYTNAMLEIEKGLAQRCPFCRHPKPETQKDGEKNCMKRVEANDPVALREFGNRRLSERDHVGALEYWTKAAELGDSVAHYQLHCSYQDGEGVEMDMKKAIYHAEQAAIGGNPRARFNLGYEEFGNHRIERAVKHWIIAANLGCDLSVEALRTGYTVGVVQKEDFAAALRAHKAALDATKSPQREEAEAKWYDDLVEERN
mmetsp:Transcript_25958/g.52060  ORF Transcript_25958/g.52060 Transcript_25958/m.52060 type:complete len:306 (+) Transcript_25958:60-977(+)